ncbi:MAG: hypothetical protein LYZ69_07040 [Nitrososphaerales archaeon]|nr:hypothetical protein [Nitrososphaerales archaeon]
MFLLVVLVPALWPHDPGCPSTYCVSLRDEVSVGTGGPNPQLGLSLVLIVQVVAVAVSVSQTMAVLVGLRKRPPVSVLRALTHIRGLSRASTGAASTKSNVFWLPIESASAGRLTSKMVRSPNLFGLGRRRGW